MIIKREYKQQLLNELYAPYKNCTLCPLAKSRTQVVFGRGNPDAQLMIVGEGPGADEDHQGLPFVGRSGKLLSKTLLALQIPEEELYITNIVKCRPDQNRLPTPEETATCTSILLYKQIEIINPVVICTLGACATQSLMGAPTPITKARGKLVASSKSGITLLPTYHPAYILRSVKMLPHFAQDLQLAFEFSKSKQK